MFSQEKLVATTQRQGGTVVGFVSRIVRFQPGNPEYTRDKAAVILPAWEIQPTELELVDGEVDGIHARCEQAIVQSGRGALPPEIDLSLFARVRQIKIEHQSLAGGIPEVDLV